MPDRQHDRIDVKLSCEITFNGDVYEAKTLNLSEGGAALGGILPCEVRDVVTVTLFLTHDGIEDPDRLPFESAASVRWVKPGAATARTLGIQFIAPSSALKAQLRDFLKRTNNA